MSFIAESKAIKRYLILSSACLSVGLGGCASEPPAFSLRDLQQTERTRSREVESRPKRALPTTLESPYLSNSNGNNAQPAAPPATGPALESDMNIRLPLQEVIHRTVMNSLDVKVAGYQPAIDETRVTEADARFDPAFFDNVQYQRTDRETGIFGAGNNRQIQNQVGIKQLLPSGGQAQLQQTTSWNEPSAARDALGNRSTKRDQFWENELALQLTQPLLRDFGNDINRARITINRNNQRISLLDFRKQLEQTISDVESAYWDLVTAEVVVKIDERLLNDTISMADVLSKRIGQDVTRVQISQANASVERRRATLIRDKARVRDLSDQIKRLMNDPDIPVASGVLVLPANTPSETPVRFDLKDQIDTALENRFELGQQQLRIDSADIQRKVAKNNLLPQLNLVGSVGIQGLDGDFKASISDQVDNKNFNVTFGFQFEIPIGNREARAIYQRSLLQRLQEIDKYRGLVESISFDITRAVREVDTTWEEMSARRQAKFAAEDELYAIEQRQLGGEALTPTFVQLKLDTQGRRADANQAEAEAIGNYNKAIKDLERAKGTLLRYDNVVMAEDSLPAGKSAR